MRRQAGSIQAGYKVQNQTQRQKPTAGVPTNYKAGGAGRRNAERQNPGRRQASAGAGAERQAPKATVPRSRTVQNP